MSTDEGSGLPQTGLCELELSDDGSSSVISEPDREQRQITRQRRGSSTASSQISPVGSSGSQRPHGSPLPSYPVSIRQQLAIIKQMEQPSEAMADSSSSPSSAQSARTSSVSPGLSKRRIPKVHKKNERGETPLHVAARKGEHRQCRKLIQDGALINARDYAGWTPLHEACYHGHTKVARLLLSYHADVNALSDCDDTPLHDAVTSGNEKLVWLLLHAGAIRDRADTDGKRPIDICRPEHIGIRNLLITAVIPDRCPFDESPSLSPSASSHRQDPSQPLTVNVTQLITEKQSIISPSSDDSIASPETTVKDRSAEISEELPAETKGTYEQSVDRREIAAENKKTVDVGDPTPKSEEPRSDIHRDFEEMESSFSLRRALWREENRNSLKTEELNAGSSAYEFDDDLTSSRGSRESMRFGVSESKEAENRRVGRPRGATRTGRFSPQHTPQKTRGRRRGRGTNTTVGSATAIAHSSQPDDVYEFRSSPESDFGGNRTGGIGDMEREMSGSPSAKRQRFTQTSTTAVTVTAPAVPSQTSNTTPECMSVSEKEAVDAAPTACEQTDEKNDATFGRKVPPLRISLPRTPSEDGGTDDMTSVTTSLGRRNTRAPRGHTKKHQSPEQSSSSVCDESLQRITRSKLRQAGRQLRDHPAISYETSAKRKSGSWRRGSTAIASPMPAPSVAASDDQTTSSNDAGDRVDAEESTQLETVTLKEDENAVIALSLMKKNSYEGFRGFRSLVEERWAKDATEKTVIPEKPPNFDNYMIVQKNYTSASSPGTELPEEKDFAFIEKLTAKLRALHAEQREKRRNMQCYQQVERERLQMQAESEVLRMLSRKANEKRASFSAMRIIRETNLFNTGFLQVKPKELPPMEISEVKEKYEKLAEMMRKRQQMESDALYAEQVFVWNAAIRRSEDLSQLELKNAVPHVPKMHPPAFTLLSYAKMVLHAYKYPHRAVVGLLIGANENSNEVTCIDAVPVLHESASLSMALEAALIFTDSYCTKNGFAIVGIYFCNEFLSDSSLDQYAVRIAEKIVSNYPNALLAQIDNSLLGTDSSEPAARVYTLDNKSWKAKKFVILNEETVLSTVSNAVQRKLYREIMDFENHLDNPANDYWNSALNEKLERFSA